MPAFKKIKDYTKTELDDAVILTVEYCGANGLDFYKILNGIDAYFERRRRKEEPWRDENASLSDPKD